MRRMAWGWLVIGYVFIFLRSVHRVHWPVWQAACFALGVVLAVGYCLEACGVPLKSALPPAHGWNLYQWPASNRRNFFRLALLGALATGILSLAGFWTGK
ncbi:MAG: hypothetical protein J5861_02100 [Desulfovibrio sp.]|nr:hypothetical protein [Desulfovibrio sp.]